MYRTKKKIIIMTKEYQLRKLQNSYEVTLHYKSVKVRVAFTGGNVYKSKMPTFRTDNLFTMNALEASELFKNKEVVLVRTTGEAPKPIKPVAQQPKKSAKPAKPAGEKRDIKPKTQAPVQEPGSETQEPADDGDGKKEFASLADAIRFVAEEYEVQVTSEAEARKVLKEHGINPTIKRG